MFCKNCGIEIADDSRYCKYCGAAQLQAGEPANGEQQHKTKLTIEIPNTKTPLSNKAKIGIAVYACWVLINFLCVYLFYTPLEKASVYFYPFTGDGIYENNYRIAHYDYTEFLVYTLIAPLALYVLRRLWRSLPKDDEEREARKKAQESAKQNNEDQASGN